MSLFEPGAIIVDNVVRVAIGNGAKVSQSATGAGGRADLAAGVHDKSGNAQQGIGAMGHEFGAPSSSADDGNLNEFHIRGWPDKKDFSDVPKGKPYDLMISDNPHDWIELAKLAAHRYGMDDTGVTYKYNAHLDAVAGEMRQNGEMVLGRRAFLSWGRLLSVLGHEIEVHWQRQIVGRGWTNENQYLHAGEYEAYSYNIENAKRFGSSPEDVRRFKKMRDIAFENLTKYNQRNVLRGRYDLVSPNEY